LAPPDEGGAYVATEPPLRALADARGMAVGAAVNPAPLRCTETYGRVLGREFNMVTTENALKFGPVHPEPGRYDFADADLIVDFAEDHAMQVRGHALVWHQQVPVWLDPEAGGTLDVTPAQREEVLREHITTVVGRYAGRIAVWDVVNEAIGEDGSGGLRETLWLAALGPGYIDRAFRWAHEADPDALLFYNDYGAEGMGGKSQQVYDLVADMVARGVPIHGVGLQMHLALGEVPDLAAVRANMTRLGELGLQVHITELDVRLPADPAPALVARQAEIYRTMMEVCLAVDACTAYVTWGFTDRYSWIPSFYPGMGEALIFDAAYRPKPAYTALREALTAGDAFEGEGAVPADFGAECDCVP
jgi:endo-1,4-beta-xylanase